MNRTPTGRDWLRAVMREGEICGQRDVVMAESRPTQGPMRGSGLICGCHGGATSVFLGKKGLSETQHPEIRAPEHCFARLQSWGVEPAKLFLLPGD